MNPKLTKAFLGLSCLGLGVDLGFMVFDDLKETPIRVVLVGWAAVMIALMWFLGRRMEKWRTEDAEAEITLTLADRLPEGIIVRVDSLTGKEQFYIVAPAEGTGPYTHRARKHL